LRASRATPDEGIRGYVLQTVSIAIQRPIDLLLHEFRAQEDPQELGKFPADIFRVLQRLMVLNANCLHVRLPVEPSIDLTQCFSKAAAIAAGLAPSL
jgi:hypothetical protein